MAAFKTPVSWNLLENKEELIPGRKYLVCVESEMFEYTGEISTATWHKAYDTYNDTTKELTAEEKLKLDPEERLLAAIFGVRKEYGTEGFYNETSEIPYPVYLPEEDERKCYYAELPALPGGYIDENESIAIRKARLEEERRKMLEDEDSGKNDPEIMKNVRPYINIVLEHALKTDDNTYVITRPIFGESPDENTDIIIGEEKVTLTLDEDKKRKIFRRINAIANRTCEFKELGLLEKSEEEIRGFLEDKDDTYKKAMQSFYDVFLSPVKHKVSESKIKILENEEENGRILAIEEQEMIENYYGETHKEIERRFGKDPYARRLFYRIQGIARLLGMDAPRVIIENEFRIFAENYFYHCAIRSYSKTHYEQPLVRKIGE